MGAYSQTREVAAPAERVFALLTDLEGAADRIPGIKSVEILSDGAFGEGTRWRETREFMGKDATEEMWITKFEPGRSYTAEAESHGCHYWTTFAVEPQGEASSKVTVTMEAKPLTFMSKAMNFVMAPMMKKMIMKCFGEDLEAIAKAAEA